MYFAVLQGLVHQARPSHLEISGEYHQVTPCQVLYFGFGEEMNNPNFANHLMVLNCMWLLLQGSIRAMPNT